MADKNNHVIISYFPGKDLAATAADEIREWDKANDAIKLGGIGILTAVGDKIKTHKLSRGSGRKGAKWGLGLGAAAGILSGGVTLVGGAVAGAVIGGVGAKLFHKSLGLSDEDKARLEQRLRDGMAALVVMADEDEAAATKAQLALLGGEVEDYQVPQETMAQVEAATEVQAAEAPEPVAEVAEPEPAAAEAEPVAEDVVAEPVAEAAEPVAPVAAAEPAAEAAAPTVVMLSGTLESVEGIGPAYVATLKAAGITTKRRLLLAGATPEGRAKLAEQTKISERLIMKWVSAVDLSRVKGVKGQYAELLAAGGVPTVGVLAAQEAGDLHTRLVALNAEKNLTRLVPGEAQLGKWIAEAKGLPQMVTL